MVAPKLSKLEFQIMEVLWERGESSIREILDSLPAKGRPAHKTIQTMVYRVEPKGVVRRIKKVGNFHILAASISRDAAQRRLIEELLALFGGRSQPVMAHLVEAANVSLEDVKGGGASPAQALRKGEAIMTAPAFWNEGRTAALVNHTHDSSSAPMPAATPIPRQPSTATDGYGTVFSRSRTH